MFAFCLFFESENNLSFTSPAKSRNQVFFFVHNMPLRPFTRFHKVFPSVTIPCHFHRYLINYFICVLDHCIHPSSPSQKKETLDKKTSWQQGKNSDQNLLIKIIMEVHHKAQYTRKTVTAIGALETPRVVGWGWLAPKVVISKPNPGIRGCQHGLCRRYQYY